jgi:hypothetical protein
MKRLLFALLVASVAAAANAQTKTVPFVFQPEPETHHTEHYPGAVVVTTHAAQIRIAYLPLLAPLPGSVPSTTSVIPTAFMLNHVEFPQRRVTARRVRTSLQP